MLVEIKKRTRKHYLYRTDAEHCAQAMAKSSENRTTAGITNMKNSMISYSKALRLNAAFLLLLVISTFTPIVHAAPGQCLATNTPWSEVAPEFQQLLLDSLNKSLSKGIDIRAVGSNLFKLDGNVNIMTAELDDYTPPNEPPETRLHSNQTVPTTYGKAKSSAITQHDSVTSKLNKIKAKIASDLGKLEQEYSNKAEDHKYQHSKAFYEATNKFIQIAEQILAWNDPQYLINNGSLGGDVTVAEGLVKSEWLDYLTFYVASESHELQERLGFPQRAFTILFDALPTETEVRALSDEVWTDDKSLTLLGESKAKLFASHYIAEAGRANADARSEGGIDKKAVAIANTIGVIDEGLFTAAGIDLPEGFEDEVIATERKTNPTDPEVHPHNPKEIGKIQDERKAAGLKEWARIEGKLKDVIVILDVDLYIEFLKDKHYNPETGGESMHPLLERQIRKAVTEGFATKPKNGLPATHAEIRAYNELLGQISENYPSLGEALNTENQALEQALARNISVPTFTDTKHNAKGFFACFSCSNILYQAVVLIQGFYSDEYDFKGGRRRR